MSCKNAQLCDCMVHLKLIVFRQMVFQFACHFILGASASTRSDRFTTELRDENFKVCNPSSLPASK